MVSLQNAIVHQLSQILFYIRRKVLNYVTSTDVKCDSVLFTCHDGQDQWAEKSLFFLQWSAHDDHMHNPSAFIMMILNGMVGQNLKPGYCVVILIMKEWRIQCQKVVVETFKSHLLNEADYIYRGITGLLAFYFLLCSSASQFGLVSLLSIVVLLALFLIILFFFFLLFFFLLVSYCTL